MGMRRLRLSCPPGREGRSSLAVTRQSAVPESASNANLPGCPGRAILTGWRSVPTGIPALEKQEASAPGSTRTVCFLFGSPADHRLDVVLWLCVPGSLRVCPFGGTPRYSVVSSLACLS